MTQYQSREGDTFPFSKLSPALREMIWKFTFLDSNVHLAVEIWHPKYSAGLQITTPPHPVALSVSRESRTVAQRHLKPFGRFIQDLPRGRSYNLGYHNPDRDTLHLFNFDHDLLATYMRKIPFSTISTRLIIDENTGMKLPEICKLLPLRKDTLYTLKFVLFRKAEGFSHHCQCNDTSPAVTKVFDCTLLRKHIMSRDQVQLVLNSKKYQTALKKWTSMMQKETEKEFCTKLEVIDLSCSCKTISTLLYKAC
jgi:hypothetical protein